MRRRRKILFLLILLPLLISPGSAQGSAISKGQDYFYDGDFDKALRYFRKAIQENPGDPLAHHFMGLAYYELKNYGNARDSFRKVLELKPDFDLARLKLAHSCLKLMDYECARAKLQYLKEKNSDELTASDRSSLEKISSAGRPEPDQKAEDSAKQTQPMPKTPAAKRRLETEKAVKALVASLYEKERQLKNKLFQLEQAQKRSRENEQKLEKLKDRAEELHRELSRTGSQETSKVVREELDKIIRAKLKREKDARHLKEKESALTEEVSELRARAEETRLEAEEAKEELAAGQKREDELARQVETLKSRLDRGMSPILVISHPKDGKRSESPATLLHFIAVDDRGIVHIDVSLNGRPVRLNSGRGIRIMAPENSGTAKKLDITERLSLDYGDNTIIVSVRDTDGMTAREVVRVTREREQGKIWAIIIGINQYAHTRDLKYADDDARAFKNYIKEYIDVPDENIFFLNNRKATKLEIESLLGTKVKRKAGKEDTVIIFFAGHGAVETDPSDPDGDGFEKYLLPHDARLDDLYSTAISMEDIKKIFQRIIADRLIFIADTCYSGASGGRTMLASKTRATLSERFFERISKGKGRVILSACSANEISKEDDRLKHGIFTYYLLEGLKGKSDQDGDGIITVSELFSFLSRKVPEASGQDQHPVRKGETEGELVIGRVK